jgi:hypothetical protein
MLQKKEQSALLNLNSEQILKLLIKLNLTCIALILFYTFIDDFVFHISGSLNLRIFYYCVYAFFNTLFFSCFSLYLLFKNKFSENSNLLYILLISIQTIILLIGIFADIYHTYLALTIPIPPLNIG